MKNAISSRALAIVALGTLSTLGTLSMDAFAQPAAGSPPMHRPRDGGDPLMAALNSVQSQLALDSSQQQQWNNAAAATKAARQQGMGLHSSAKAVFDAEIAKAQPDFAAVAAAAEQARSQGEALRKGVRDQWLAVYAGLNAQQKSVVASAIRERMAAFADKRAARHGGS